MLAEMRGVSAFIIVAISNFCFCYQPKGRTSRSIQPGSSNYKRYSLDTLTTFRIEHTKSKSCLEWNGRSLVTAPCVENNDAQVWKMVKDKDWYGRLKNVKYGQCLGVRSSNSDTLVLTSCSTNIQLTSWTCYFHLSVKGKPWRDYDWPAMKRSTANKCISVSSVKVSLRTCTDYRKDDDQRLNVLGTYEMGICSKAGNLGPTTENSRYYYLQDPKFQITWNTKWIRVHMTYAYNIYKAFQAKYRSHNAAMQAIRHHAQDTMNMVDKLYRQIGFRIVLVGIEVFYWGEKIPKASSSRQLHSSVYQYSRDLRLKKGLKFDTSIYYFDGDLFGAAGTASNNFCSQSKYTEVAIIATIGGDARLDPRDLTHILTHEVAHLLHSPHNFDPYKTCPVYHLYGGRCTLGGNDWPKGFSSGELDSIRYYKYTCLDNKPPQNTVLGCGNGVIEPGEECDCGRSQKCLTSDPCCEGSVCKLKKGKACSNEKCCDRCQINTRKSGCTSGVITLNKKDGYIENPKTKNFNVLNHWKIQGPRGTKILLSFHMPFFEFNDNCPYDYIEVRDGAYATSRSLGKYCRSPPGQTLLSSTNNVFITYRADQTFESKFKIQYSAIQKMPPIQTPFVIKDTSGQCAEANSKRPTLELSSRCSEKFQFTKNYNLQHVQTKLCLVPHMYAKSYVNFGEISLKGDCLTTTSIYTVLPSSGLIFHPVSGMCLVKYGASARLSTTCKGSNAMFTVGSGFAPPMPPASSQKYLIKHYSGSCLAADPTKAYVYLTRNCNEKFAFHKNGALAHVQSGKCLTPSGNGDNSFIDLSSFCGAESVFRSTSYGSLLHVATNKCIHPLNGARYPRERTRVVIYYGCSDRRLRFSLVKA